MDIVVSRIINTTKGISNATVTKQYGNWKIWCNFLTHAGVEDKLLDGIQYRAKTTLVSSLASLVWRKQFGTTNKSKLLYIAFNTAILDVSASFGIDLWSDLNLDAAGQENLILRRQLRGYKQLDSPTKHYNAILVNILLHIYNKQNFHFCTSIGKLISRAFFFGMRSCEYLKPTRASDSAENAANSHTTLVAST